MNSIIKFLFIVLLIIMQIKSNINDFIPCYNGLNSVVPINISNYISSSFLKMNMIFTEENTILNDLKISVNNIGIQISGKLTDIYLDLNTNFSKGDKNIVVSYECNNLTIISPSINKFWQLTMDLEINLKCIIKNNEVFNIEFAFSPILNIIIPVSNISKPNISLPLIEISEYASNNFVKNLADNIRLYDYKLKSKEAFNELNNNFKLLKKIESSLFENEYYENNEFFIFNGDNSIECRPLDTYIFMNRYLLVNSDDFKTIKDFLINFKLDLENEVKSIVYNQDQNLKIYRNFEVLDIRDQYEKLITTIGSLNRNINFIILFLCLKL